MLGWKKRQIFGAGSVLFQGSIPPRLEEFEQLARSGVQVSPGRGDPEAHWSAGLSHPAWGKAEVVCLRQYVPVPRVVVEFDPRLSKAEKDAAIGARSGISIRMTTSKEDVLSDRKLLLRYLRCLMGDDGVMVVDHLAHKFWTREMLDEEIAHDADLDIDSLFIIHLIHDGEEGGDQPARPYWAHTHGLAELGALDFDILRPSPLLCEQGNDPFRAIAFQILEGKITAGRMDCQVLLPGPPVGFVSVEEFNRRGGAADLAIRGDVADPVHNTNRLVACEPRRGGLLGWLTNRHVRPSKLLSTIDDDHVMTIFTNSATNLMAERARKTIDVFRRLAAELAEFQVKALVKLGLRVDGGGPEDREHMWFEVHGCGLSDIDATLLNEPFNVSRLKAGERGRHDLDVMTDWTIMTPCGTITPRAMQAARFLRNNREEILKVLAENRPERQS